MASSLLGLRTVIYKVPDLEQAKNWYSITFGTEPYFDQPFYVGFNIGGFELGLDPDGYRENQNNVNVVAYWGTEHIQETFDRFIQLGATPIEAPTNVGGEIMVSTVVDPWGNRIGLIYNPEFKL